MNISLAIEHPYVTLAVIAFFINIPLGYIREQFSKMSLAWLFWIHASIPLIIYLRMTLGTSKLFIPVSIALAIAGQIVGSRTCRNHNQNHSGVIRPMECVEN